ncbi:hypothetical protein [Polaribacter sp. Z022]|uniref:hypothetical protein n=1 Tax=Polaribacter sp. Z022 TaxID=2927125 RepID=UPI002021705E|nr:hypothetical protein [Polaribacter sp. Z022]MCL7755017.1 hypothetical protein [Polaribacter sp. Z022]
MNEIAPLFEFFLNWDTYEELLNAVYNNVDYSKICLLLIFTPLLLLTTFYKFWDPVSSSKLKWWVTIFIVSIFSYIGASLILYNNPEIIQYLGNYTGENGQPDAHYFIFQMSMITLGCSLIVAIILSIIPFRLLSTNNRNNPF